jgi:hypothetical protein
MHVDWQTITKVLLAAIALRATPAAAITLEQEIAIDRYAACMWLAMAGQLGVITKQPYVLQRFLKFCKDQLAVAGYEREDRDKLIIQFNRIYTEHYNELMSNVRAWHEMENRGLPH